MLNIYKQKNKLSIITKTCLTLFSVIVAVALPQILHLLGRYMGSGVMLGTILLPMHLPVIFVGLMAGPIVGVITGFCSPIISFAISGMPMITMLPFMVIELCAYGLVSGLLSYVSIPNLIKVLITQIAGRLIYILSMFIFGVVFNFTTFNLLAILKSFLAGYIGLIIQLITIPCVFYLLKLINNNKNKGV